MTEATSFGVWLERELAERDWLQADLARQIGRRPGAVSRWMHGTKPDPDACYLIARALGISPQEVLYRAGWVDTPGLDREEGELLAIYRGVDDADRDAILRTARALFSVGLQRQARDARVPTG